MGGGEYQIENKRFLGVWGYFKRKNKIRDRRETRRKENTKKFRRENGGTRRRTRKNLKATNYY